MTNGPPLDAFSAHEVLHTASIIADMFERHISDHRFTQSDAELRDTAEKAHQLLYDFYQLVGRKVL